MLTTIDILIACKEDFLEVICMRGLLFTIFFAQCLNFFLGSIHKVRLFHYTTFLASENHNFNEDLGS